MPALAKKEEEFSMTGQDDERPIKRSTVEARQGSRTKANLRVLVFSLVFAFAILAVLYLVFFSGPVPS